MTISNSDYYRLNQYGAILILLLIRIIVGLISAFNGVFTPTEMLKPEYQILPTLYVIVLALLIICIVFFFKRNVIFIITYGIVAIISILLNLWVQSFFGALVVLIIEGLFMTYLLVSKRSKIVFRLVDVTVENLDDTVTHISAGIHSVVTEEPLSTANALQDTAGTTAPAASIPQSQPPRQPAPTAFAKQETIFRTAEVSGEMETLSPAAKKALQARITKNIRKQIK